MAKNTRTEFHNWLKKHYGIVPKNIVRFTGILPHLYKDFKEGYTIPKRFKEQNKRRKK